MQHCDRLIAKQYTGMTEKWDGLSQVCAEIDGDEVEVLTDIKHHITFDKTPTKVWHQTEDSNYYCPHACADFEERYPLARVDAD